MVAAQGLTWDQVKAKFEVANPALKADALGVEEMKAQEVTAFLRPNPQLTVGEDGTQIAPHNGVWAPLSDADLKSLEASTNNPVKITFEFKYADGYLPPSDDQQFVWGVKFTPEQEASFKANRPDLFGKKSDEVPYPAVTMGFVVFSSICPHLGCRYQWQADAKRFICPCHGSQFGIQGNKLAGPAPRGLDPLPFRDTNGKAEITWIQYKSGTPDRIIVSYS